jgi:hypothetical protein
VVDGRGRRAFVRLAAAEVVLMAATVALGVALSRTATPATIDSRPHAAGTYAHDLSVLRANVDAA